MSTGRKLFLFVALPLVVVFIGIVAYSAKDRDNSTGNINTPAEVVSNCAQIQPPIDLSKVTGILYPGQVRGGDFKPHGGFRLDGLKSNDVSVVAPVAAKVAHGSRYIEQGELQYMFDFETDCGLDYRLDHLKTLSAKMLAAAETLPEPKIDDSQTNNIHGVRVELGEVIATAVGFENGNPAPNVSFDLGVYSQKQKNTASNDSAWVAAHKGDGKQAIYALCWLDLLPAADAATLRALPAGDGNAGKVSDYCL